MIIADTGFWVALANPRDKHHARAREALHGIDERLITTWPVLAETCHLLLRELGSLSQERFVAGWSGGAFELFPMTDEHVPRILELMRTYRSLPMDLADASLVLLAEALGHGRILSTDTRDFGAYRWKNRKPFENLLL